jgi:UDP-2,4-diacetamido-2,4,6-trideoxy-beta-L-altropyranose hydrolase
VTAGEQAPQVTLRPARPTDAEVLRRWRNEATAVRFSGSARQVSPAEHDRWLAERLADPATRLRIAEENGVPVGQVRVEMTGGSGAVSIAVAAGARGRGLGQAMLRATVEEVARDGDGVTLTALAHPDNPASIHAFERVGFLRRGSRENGFVVLEWRAPGQPRV